MSSRWAESRTERVTACWIEAPAQPSPWGAKDTRPRDGFMPKSPQQDAGVRIEPPPSLAWAAGTIPAATAAAAPPEDPPGVRDRSQGLRQTPRNSDSVLRHRPNSGVLVLPQIESAYAL